jgi:hypothetical protein
MWWLWVYCRFALADVGFVVGLQAELDQLKAQGLAPTTAPDSMLDKEKDPDDLFTE